MNIKLKRIFLSLFFFIYILTFGSFAMASDVQVDFAGTSLSPQLSDGEKVKIEKLYVSYEDENGYPASGHFDVIFEWDSEKFALVPVSVSGCYNGELRVQVSSSVTNAPLVGAIVTIGDKITQTDEDGIARFGELEDKIISVRSDATDYVSSGQQIEISCNQMVTVDIGLMPVQ